MDKLKEIKFDIQYIEENNSLTAFCFKETVRGRKLSIFKKLSKWTEDERESIFSSMPEVRDWFNVGAQIFDSRASKVESTPTTEITELEVGEGIFLTELLMRVGITDSKSEGKRLIIQKGISVNEIKEGNFLRTIDLQDFVDGKLLINKGKKVAHIVKTIGV